MTPPDANDPSWQSQRIARLEEELRQTQAEHRQALKRNDYFAALIGRLDQYLDDVEASARWRIGNWVVRCIERLLLRPEPTLVLSRMKSALQSAQRDERRGWKLSIGARTLSSPADGEPLADQIGKLGQLHDSQLERWLKAAAITSLNREKVEAALRDESLEMVDLCRATHWKGPLPLVSIVMPTLNRAHVIGEAIESVLDQSYPAWELLICDDGSTDETASIVSNHADSRVRHVRLDHQGAAAARNSGLARSTGAIIAYLDSDNIWHPDFLAVMVATLLSDRGRYCAYAAYFDVDILQDTVRLRAARTRAFDYESLCLKNFIDLNCFVHWRELFDQFGGFTRQLPRQQDWDLILKYTFLRDPLVADYRLTLYRRNAAWNQLTALRESTAQQTADLIKQNLDGYYRNGLPAGNRSRLKVTVLIWDICRNHFSKAFNVAEALSVDHDVQLIGFRFFDEPIFPPYSNVAPAFETLYFDGASFPEFFDTMAQALGAITGDIIYCVKPRTPSLGLALLAHYHRGLPLILECNDLESIVSSPQTEQLTDEFEFDPTEEQLKVPYHQEWTRYFEYLARQLPLKVTHNQNLAQWLGGHCHFLRNIKDEGAFDPATVERDAVRKRLGFDTSDRVILFAGLVRQHKGIFALQELVDEGPDHLRLLVVGSRMTPDLQQLKSSGKVVVLPPQDRNKMAEMTAAADGIVLWLDPSVPVSHYQMPFKLTDALAMEVPVFANRISDLEELIDSGYVCEVPFGDARALVQALERDDASRATRQLYLRQYSYMACRANFALLAQRAAGFPDQLPAAQMFARDFDRFYQHATRS